MATRWEYHERHNYRDPLKGKTEMQNGIERQWHLQNEMQGGRSWRQRPTPRRNPRGPMMPWAQVKITGLMIWRQLGNWVHQNGYDLPDDIELVSMNHIGRIEI